MLELQNIKWKVSDGTEIIKNINLEIPSGKLVVITGPNGGEIILCIRGMHGSGT